MVDSFLIFVANAGLWICAILNDVMMVCFCRESLVLCSYNESFCFGLETRRLKPLVCCFHIIASLIREGYTYRAMVSPPIGFVFAVDPDVLHLS